MKPKNKHERKAARLHLAAQNRKHPPTLIELSLDDASAEAKSLAHKPSRIWQSSTFAVALWIDSAARRRLTVCRTAINSEGNWKDGITWDELQRLKAEAGFGECWAVECYPPDSLLVNVANMRHLWLCDTPPREGWHST